MNGLTDTDKPVKHKSGRSSPKEKKGNLVKNIDTFRKSLMHGQVLNF